MAGETKQAEDYRAYRARQIEAGAEFADHVSDVLYAIGLPIGAYGSRKWQDDRGENRAGVEVKFDDKYAETGNLWIETAEKSHPENETWVPSGIYREDNTWLYAIGNYEVLFIFAKTALRILSLQRDGDGWKFVHTVNGTETSTGFLLPDGWARRYAAKVIGRGASSSV